MASLVAVGDTLMSWSWSHYGNLAAPPIGGTASSQVALSVLGLGTPLVQGALPSSGLGGIGTGLSTSVLGNPAFPTPQLGVSEGGGSSGVGGHVPAKATEPVVPSFTGMAPWSRWGFGWSWEVKLGVYLLVLCLQAIGLCLWMTTYSLPSGIKF